MGSHEGTILFLEYNLTDEASQSNFTDQINLDKLAGNFQYRGRHSQGECVGAGGRATPKL